MQQFDRIDRKILDILQRDGRISITDLAQQVGLSATPCADRVRRLERTGVITGYHASVSPESLGYAMNALVGIFLTDNADTDVVAGQLAALPVVEHCWFVAGEETFVVKVRVPDVAGLEETIRTLNAMSGIARTRTTVVLSTKFEDRVPS